MRRDERLWVAPSGGVKGPETLIYSNLAGGGASISFTFASIGRHLRVWLNAEGVRKFQPAGCFNFREVGLREESNSVGVRQLTIRIRQHFQCY